ncbi:MAG: LLM class flavin-dependent oxidoreductase [Proteobacteria bacterium]|nr:LLM class flavin-dependent oxidoreductase [Pseudomonadota bacterium]
MSGKILLNAFDMNTPGHQSNGLWRHPRDKSHHYNSLTYWQDLARTLERGLFDGIFIADVTGVYDVYGGTPEAALRACTQIPTNDPFVIVPAMAAVTEHLTFGVTGSIPYLHPYSFARLMSSLDHLTDGRIGWNVVTGYLNSAAKGVGSAQQTTHDTRYDIAHEFMEVVYKLWEGSWEDGAVVRDAARAIYTDPAKVHSIHHDGTYFALDAIHLCEPSPQRTPLIYQAGTSPKGMNFAGTHAECVFVANHSKNTVANQVRSLRQQAVQSGRGANDLKIFTMLSVVVGETDKEAQAKFEDYRQYGIAEGALALISGWTGVDMSQFDSAAKLDNVKSESIQAMAESLCVKSVGEWADHLMVGGAAPVVVGSPATVVDEMQAWIDATGADGFNLSYTVLPECIEDFVRLVVPEMQRRGIYKTAYAAGTARDKLFGKGARLAAPHPAAGYRAVSR